LILIEGRIRLGICRIPEVSNYWHTAITFWNIFVHNGEI
jgi:hypothetical protein